MDRSKRRGAKKGSKTRQVCSTGQLHSNSTGGETNGATHIFKHIYLLLKVFANQLKEWAPPLCDLNAMLSIYYTPLGITSLVKLL